MIAVIVLYPHQRTQQGVYHSALDDARSQAEHLIQIAPQVICD